MAKFTDTVSALNALLVQRGYTLTETTTKVVFKQATFDAPIFALPDVHLCDGGPGDIFVNGNPDKPRRLASVLRAIFDYQNLHPHSSRSVQLGDWFDIWRVCGSDPKNMAYGAIQNARAFQEIFDLDAQIGLAHVLGNHDASFLNSLPDRRTGQPSLFRLGFWLGSNVYALHGHQTDITPQVGSDFDEFAVAAATVIARFIPGVVSFEDYVDRLGFVGGGAKWVLDSLLGLREDPGPQARPIDRSAAPASVASGSFVVRERLDHLATIVHKVELLPESHGRSAEVLIVGHSHRPCAAWTDVSGKPLVVVDAGGWVYDQANLLVAAEDTIAVFDVKPIRSGSTSRGRSATTPGRAVASKKARRARGR
jgi:UDP-2,3-diacylglucosamine pyrophosphatase LpxH